MFQLPRAAGCIHAHDSVSSVQMSAVTAGTGHSPFTLRTTCPCVCAHGRTGGRTDGPTRTDRRTDKPTERPTDRPTDRSVGPSVRRSVGGSVGWSVGRMERRTHGWRVHQKHAAPRVGKGTYVALLGAVCILRCILVTTTPMHVHECVCVRTRARPSICPPFNPCTEECGAVFSVSTCLQVLVMMGRIVSAPAL